MPKSSPKIQIRIGSAPKSAFRHSIPRAAVSEIICNGKRVAFRTNGPRPWTFVLQHASEAAARSTEAKLSEKKPVRLSVVGSIKAVLAANDEAVQSEGFSPRMVSAYAIQRHLIATRVSAPKRGVDLYLLHSQTSRKADE